MHRWLMISLAAVPLFVATLRPTSPPKLIWWTTHALEKIRPSDRVPAEPLKSAAISAARNEFEAFQVVLRAEGQALENVDVDVSDFRGPNGARIAKRYVTVYFEAMLDLKKPSSTEGRDGEWPDPLIPREDRYAGEQRNAFPFTLAANRNQPIWIETYIPPSTPAGSYAAEVQLSLNQKVQATVPVTLQVWNFAIPSTSSLPNTF